MVGDGIETFGVWVVTPARYVKSSTWMSRTWRKRPGDRQARWREVNGLGRVGTRRDCTADLDAGELFEEVEVEPRASELAIGDAAHADRLDLSHGVGDCLVLDGALVVGGDRAGSELLASIEHGLRAQQTADVVGSERRVDRTHGKCDCR